MGDFYDHILVDGDEDSLSFSLTDLNKVFASNRHVLFGQTGQGSYFLNQKGHLYGEISTVTFQKVSRRRPKAIRQFHLKTIASVKVHMCTWTDLTSDRTFSNQNILFFYQQNKQNFTKQNYIHTGLFRNKC